jgi:hypothetical protein
MRHGWFGERVRHSFAARGIQTRYRKRFPRLVRHFPGENPRVTGRFARFRQQPPSTFIPGSFRIKRVSPGTVLVLGKEKSSGKQEVQSVLKDRKVYFSEKSLFGTTKEESAGEFIRRNVETKTDGDGLQQFREDVAFMARHPMQDLDGEWEEYTSLADNKYYGPVGVPEPLSSDRAERAVQRGAALFGRVASQANVEPLVDGGENDRTMRDVTTDFLFGRRIR